MHIIYVRAKRSREEHKEVKNKIIFETPIPQHVYTHIIDLLQTNGGNGSSNMSNQLTPPPSPKKKRKRAIGLAMHLPNLFVLRGEEPCLHVRPPDIIYYKSTTSIPQKLIN
jgi:hypothetical protein